MATHVVQTLEGDSHEESDSHHEHRRCVVPVVGCRGGHDEPGRRHRDVLREHERVVHETAQARPPLRHVEKGENQGEGHDRPEAVLLARVLRHRDVSLLVLRLYAAVNAVLLHHPYHHDNHVRANQHERRPGAERRREQRERHHTGTDGEETPEEQTDFPGEAHLGLGRVGVTQSGGEGHEGPGERDPGREDTQEPQHR